MIGAVVAGQVANGDDPLLRHFGVHGRLLVSIPLLLLAELLMERAVPRFTRHFVDSGLVAEEDRRAFAAGIRSAERFRDSAWGSVFVVAAMALVVALWMAGGHAGHELNWAERGGKLGFAGMWYALVSRPVFMGLLAAWVWRLASGIRLLWMVSKLNLRLVASHPDQMGGVGFLQGLGAASAPIVMAVSVVLAARWGHDVMYHGEHVNNLRVLVGVFVALMLILFAGPVMMMSGTLRAFKRRALLQYGKLAGSQGRLVHEKWIEGREVGEEAVLEAPELGPVADMHAIYEAVEKMKPMPIGLRLVAPIVAAAGLPMVPVFAIEVPLKELLGKIVGALL
jgi:hypothetical protein